MKYTIYICLLFTITSYAQTVTFTDVSDTTIGYYTFGNGGMLGGGVSFTDFDGDGFDDLAFASNANMLSKIVKGNGVNFDSTFVIADSILYGEQVKQLLWADIDNDQDNDLYVVCFRGTGSRLYRNDNGHFVDITSTSGIWSVPQTTYGATWGDYNRDG